ncbi:MAG: hypothetical protein EON60_13890 [Alphaproteobacteria bacterium]|nr:MAG: hypothetical protein EON60_13890 [Alphaproteobacteria bacterium]
MTLLYNVFHRLYGALLFTLLHLAFYALLLVLAFLPFFVLVATMAPYQNFGWFVFAFAVVYPTYGIVIRTPMAEVFHYWFGLQKHITATYRL